MTLCGLTKQHHVTRLVLTLSQNRTEIPCEVSLFQQQSIYTIMLNTINIDDVSFTK